MSSSPLSPQISVANRPYTASLSPEARALLSELSTQEFTPAPAPRFDSPTQTAPTPEGLLAPHEDARAVAFADLLNHVGDAAPETAFDEASALAAVENYKAEKNTHPSASPSAVQTAPAMEAVDEQGHGGGDIGIELIEDGRYRDAASDDDDDAFFELEEEPATRWGQFVARLSRKSNSLAPKLVGVKDASTAYRSQSGRSLLPFTLVRAFALVLVAAVPPLVNLTVIQPQISDNNRKLTQIRSYEAKSQEDEKVANAVSGNLVRVQRLAESQVRKLMPEAAFQTLFNGYLAALQKYDVEILSYNVASDAQRKVVVGDQVQEASVVAMELVGRYDVYTEIRQIFVEQSQNILVLSEAFEVVPGSLDLKINARFMVPTLRAYDAELDTPIDAKSADTKSADAKKETG
ncbi:MAG: hypothetical protein HN835_07965 [Rhodobiaceae bacterium]|nr:hypothetical protein [Rhodobiaceae bacterium]